MKNITAAFITIIVLVAILLPIDATARKFFGIIDYTPSLFIELADEPFFYSIGKTLRYGKTINDSSPVLFNGSFFGGDLKDVYVAPNNKKAAFFYDDKLYLSKITGPAVLLLKNCRGNKYNKIKLGETYYSLLQWDAESRFIYMIRDKKQAPTPKSCWLSPNAVLIRIDTELPTKISEVINDFNSLNYFFIETELICYNYAPGDGSVIWKCFNRDAESFLVTSHQSSKIFLENGDVINGKPFVSYFGNIYESEIWLTNYGYSFRANTDGTIGLFSKHDIQKPIFKIQGTHNIKGHFCDGILQQGCKVLPGGRYALLNVWHDNFKGQLLVDGQTGKYRELPAKTNVYLNLNSYNYEHFNFIFGPGQQPEFLPATRLQTNY